MQASPSEHRLHTEHGCLGLLFVCRRYIHKCPRVVGIHVGTEPTSPNSSVACIICQHVYSRSRSERCFAENMEHYIRKPLFSVPNSNLDIPIPPSTRHIFTSLLHVEPRMGYNHGGYCRRVQQPRVLQHRVVILVACRSRQDLSALALCTASSETFW